MDGRWRRGDNDADKKMTKITINKCAAAEAEDVFGGRGRGRPRLARGGAQWWRQRSSCCTAAEEKQLHNKAMEDGAEVKDGQVGRRRAECSFFFFSWRG